MFKFISLLSLAAVAQSALTYRGADWSSTIVEEKAGKVYKTTAGVTTPLETLLKNNGVNTVRQRIWVSDSSEYNLAYNIELGKRAAAAGLSVYLDFHYSDTWADPGKQGLPAGWPSDIKDLTSKVYNYTMGVLNEFSGNKIPVSIVSIGNEISSGLLWPTGTTSSWPNIASLLHSAAYGVKDSNLTTKPQIMIHLDSGWDRAMQTNWYEQVLASGNLLTSDFDIIGLTHYPFYGNQATLANIKDSMTTLATNYGKKIVIAETDWPVSCPSPANSFPPDVSTIPFSAAGQTTWVKNLAAAVAGISGGVGLFYWEPAWLDNASLGSSCADNLFFESDGTARSSLSVFSSI